MIDYKCANCGVEIEINEKTKKCPHCGAKISKENDASGNLQNAHVLKIETADDLNALVEDYKKSRNGAKIRTAVQSYDEYTELFDYTKVWRRFIIDAVGAAVETKDRELQLFLKNHAREFDTKAKDSSLFLSLMQAYPKVGTPNDWDELIRHTAGNESEFAVLCDSIISYIVKKKDRAFAVSIFNIIKAKGEEWVQLGRIYIRALLDSDEVSSEVFPIPAFNGANCKFADNLRAYCKRFLVKDNSIALEQSKVWVNYLEAKRRRKKRNIIIAVSAVAAVAVTALVLFLVLNATNKDTVAFDVEKVIETTYGEALPLEGYSVSYKKNSGEAITLPLTLKMLNGYDPEAVGVQQSAYFEVAGVRETVTIIVKTAKLLSPKLTQSGNYVTWETVPHATSYAVYVNATAVETETTNSLSYDMSKNHNHGELSITVRALSGSDKYEDSQASEPLVVTKLSSPTDFLYENGKLTWSPVSGATTYELVVNGTPYVTNSPECELKFVIGNNEISINAKGTDNSVVHGKAQATLYYNRLDPITAMSYGEGKVSWSASSDAKSFAVYVNGQYWRDFNRNNFSIETDGFKEAFGDGNYDIGIICKTSAIGIEASAMKSYKVSVGNHIRLEDGNLRWQQIGTGATYFVYVNGDLHTYGDSYFAISECAWNVGNNTVSVGAKFDNEDYVCETINVIKHAKPAISVSDLGWSIDESPYNLYSINGGAWISELPEISSIGAGTTVIRAKRAVSSPDALELESEVVEISVQKLSAPTIKVEEGKLVCDHDSAYTLNLYRFNVSSGEWIKITSLDAIAEAGEYDISAILSGDPGSGAFYLSSDRSNVLTVTKPAAPTVVYDKENGLITSSDTRAKFYYKDESGKEHEVVGGKVENLPGGVFSVYARVNATDSNILDSENTPESGRVSVFNLDVDFKVTLQTGANKNLCYFVFDNCTDIDTLTFSYKVEYLNSNGEVIGGIDKTNTTKTAGKGSGSSDVIRDQINYRIEGTFESGGWSDVKQVRFTIYITSGTETLQKDCTVNYPAG